MAPDAHEAIFLRGLAELLEVAPNSMGPDLQLNDANWDSVAVISAIALIDETYCLTIRADVLRNCGSVAELLNAVHTAARNEGAPPV